MFESTLTIHSKQNPFLPSEQQMIQEKVDHIWADSKNNPLKYQHNFLDAFLFNKPMQKKKSKYVNKLSCNKDLTGSVNRSLIADFKAYCI